jgi:HTH-type transcriptional regulator/antitoxin HigA
MEKLLYRIIKSKTQYKSYCALLEELIFSGMKDRETKDKIALLELLIQKWEKENLLIADIDPIQLLLSLMEEHELKAKDLVQIIGKSKGFISDILHYKKGISKDVIRSLAGYFKIDQEGFNRPYKLINAPSIKRRVLSNTL